MHRRQECAEREFFLVDQFQDLADELVGRDLDRLADQPVDMVFHPCELGELLACGML